MIYLTNIQPGQTLYKLDNFINFWFDRNYSPQINLDETDFEKNGNSVFFFSKNQFFSGFSEKVSFSKI